VPFRDLHDYVAIPRLTAIRLSPDGSWLAAAVQTVDADGKKFVSSIWRIEAGPAGSDRGPARLTRSAEGEGGPEFLPDGSLLFGSKRPGQAAGTAADGDGAADKAALWLLPAGGGEASRIAAPPGGVAALATARAARSAVFASPALPGTSGPAEDAARRKARKDAGVTAILHEAGAVRYWDHDLGPDSLRLQAAQIPGPGTESAAAGHRQQAAEPRDLTPDPGRALDNSHFELTPDGSLVVAGWAVWDTAAHVTDEVVTISVATGERRTLLSAPGHDFFAPRISPDGRLVACLRAAHDSYQCPALPAARVAMARKAPGPPPDRVTCWPGWTAGRWRPPGRRTRRPSTSPPTTRAGARSSGWTWRRRRSPGSAPTTARTRACARRRTAAGSTRCGRQWTRRPRRSGWTRRTRVPSRCGWTARPDRSSCRAR
jgi:hypothetical protein